LKEILSKILKFSFLVFFFCFFMVGYGNARAEYIIDTAGEEVPGEPGAKRRVYVPYFNTPKTQNAPAVNLNISQIEVSEFPVIKVYAQVTDESGNRISGLTVSNFSLT